jgi:hypothetical protein
MSARKTMKTFFAAMNEQVGMGGYGSKIKSTPVGPFRWNDLTQLWENVNNGMVMNNVSFQDMFIMGYEVNNNDSGSNIITTSLSPVTLWGNLNSMGSGTNRTVWANNSGGNTLIANGQAVTFTLRAPISVTLTVVYGDLGDNLANVKYELNGSGTIVTYSTAFTVSNGNTLKIAATTPSTIVSGNSGSITVTDTTNSAVLGIIPFIFG